MGGLASYFRAQAQREGRDNEPNGFAKQFAAKEAKEKAT
jgi:phosphopantetheinyl transferase (holo-ACP synthase)